jgi:queuine tRNA-ribosyltransferase
MDLHFGYLCFSGFCNRMVDANHLSQLQIQKSGPSFTYRSTGYHNARLGEINTAHGTIETPAFIFCATKAAMKGVDIQTVKAADTQVILSNTYHLMLRPGGKYIKERGGLQKFTGWNGPMLTDSGGFQVFSLGSGDYTSELKNRYHGGRFGSQGGIAKVTEEGVMCKSYYDGAMFHLTPEYSIELQCQMGADLVVVFDECTPFSNEYEFTQQSTSLCHRWAQRSLTAFQEHYKSHQGLYGIIHGGIFPELRKESALFNNGLPFFGQAIGGSLGQTQVQMEGVVGAAMVYVTKDRPMHLLGVGKIADIFMGIKYGIDTFDCVHPTRIARHGCALVKRPFNNHETREHLNLRNAIHANDDRSLEDDCGCPTCLSHSRAYLHYLLTARENIVINLLSIHNVHFMNRLMKSIRQALQDNTVRDLEERYL